MSLLLLKEHKTDSLKLARPSIKVARTRKASEEVEVVGQWRVGNSASSSTVVMAGSSDPTQSLTVLEFLSSLHPKMDDRLADFAELGIDTEDTLNSFLYIWDDEDREVWFKDLEPRVTRAQMVGLRRPFKKSSQQVAS